VAAWRMILTFSYIIIKKAKGHPIIFTRPDSSRIYLEGFYLICGGMPEEKLVFLKSVMKFSGEMDNLIP
jgi:hypothetical protein